jgi:hypothetical protein
MEILIITFALVLIYLTSVYFMRYYLKIIHSKYGRYYSCEIDALDIFINFCPLINTIASIIKLFDNPYNDKYKDRFQLQNLINKFYS